MVDCLGFSFLGQCAYDPSNPMTVYFSIGEGIAALTITLIIPQFMKPIYRFRLQAQAISMTHVFGLVFAGTLCTIVAALLPHLNLSTMSFLAFPIVWEIAGGSLFFSAIAVFAMLFLKPSKVKRKYFPRYVIAAADFLAHANEQDRTDFSKDLLLNLIPIIKSSEFGRGRQEISAFFDFRYRIEIRDAHYAYSFLELVSEPRFCETLVHRCPWDTAAMLNNISDRKVPNGWVERLIQEIGRQAIMHPESMVDREIGYEGFRAAPVLSKALFEDPYINRHFQPTRKIRFDDFKGFDEKAVKRYFYAVRRGLKSVLDSGDYHSDNSLASLSDQVSDVSRVALRQVRSNDDNFHTAFAVKSGMDQLYKDTIEHFASIDEDTYESLFVDDVELNKSSAERLEHRDFTIIDELSEAIVQYFFVFSNDFDGFDDAYWSSAINLTQLYFHAIGDQPDGMNPLQQRIALKLIAKVKDNMDGWYPAVTRVLLSVIGSYDSEVKGRNPKSAYSLLKNAFYCELKRFPALYEKDATKAQNYLPPDVRYDEANATFTKRYRGGEERTTEILKLDLEPVTIIKMKINLAEE